MAMLRIGTCSWKYASWEGLVYSAPGGINFLEECARRYDTVEVDQWFWSLFAGDRVVLPDPAVVEECGCSVPATFKFTAPPSSMLPPRSSQDAPMQRTMAAISAITVVLGIGDPSTKGMIPRAGGAMVGAAASPG